MVLVILAMVWAAVLVPPMLRARSEGRPADSITSFRRQLHVLQRTNGAPSMAPMSARVPAMQTPFGAPVLTASARRRQTMRRRRDVFFGLLLAMGGSLLLGFIPALRVMWGLHLALDLAFVGYVAMLIRLRSIADERDMKVRFLPERAPMAETAEPATVLAFRRSGS